MSTDTVKATSRRLQVVNVYAGPAGNNLPEVSATVLNGRDWVSYGRANTFPEYCLAVIANCAPLAAAAQRMQMFLEGVRFEPLDKNGEVVQGALDDYMSWFGVDTDNGQSHQEAEYRRRVMSDIAHMSSLSVDVATSIGQAEGTGKGRKVAALYHRDVARLRVGKPNVKTGKIEKNYWCANWEKVGSTRYKAIPIPVFDPKNPGANKLASIYAGRYTAGMEFYYLPAWVGALADAETWASIPIHNKTQADAGFSATHILAVPGNKDQVDLDKIDEDIEVMFTGARGKRIMTVLKGNSGERVEVLPVQRGDQPGESEGLRDKATNHILTAYHGFPKVLLGMDINAGMGGAGLALEETWNHFVSTSVIPLQSIYTDLHCALLRLNGHAEVVGGRIVSHAPFKFVDNELKRKEYLATTTVNDALRAQGRPELPADDARGKMMLAEIGTTYNIPMLLDKIQNGGGSTPPANA